MSNRMGTSLHVSTSSLQLPHALLHRVGHSITIGTTATNCNNTGGSDDSVRVLLFGGGVLCHNDMLPTVRNFNDLHEWNLETGQCTLLCDHKNRRLAFNENIEDEISYENDEDEEEVEQEEWLIGMRNIQPCPREHHAAVMRRGDLVILAGQTGIRSRLMDMFLWQSRRRTWRRIEFKRPRYISPFVRLVPLERRRGRQIRGERELHAIAADDDFGDDLIVVEQTDRIQEWHAAATSSTAMGELDTATGHDRCHASGFINHANVPVWCQAPYPRENTACCYLRDRDSLIVHGGWIGGSLRFDDLFLFCIKSRKWFTLPQWTHGKEKRVCRVPASSHHCFPLTRTRTIFCGGTLRNIWEYDLVRYTWRRLKFDGETIAPEQWIGRPLMNEKRRYMVVFSNPLQPHVYQFDTLVCMKIDLTCPIRGNILSHGTAQEFNNTANSNIRDGEDRNEEDEEIREDEFTWLVLDHPARDMVISQQSGTMYIFDRPQEAIGTNQDSSNDTVLLYTYHWVSHEESSMKRNLHGRQVRAMFTDMEIMCTDIKRRTKRADMFDGDSNSLIVKRRRLELT